ncbi:hypothetical protein RFI_34428 [Reticulomyxa filosa]|uniref:Uncharacterized protein n=1 Tax=Reticulomyxa filosa TaxID=46433 RepID=X6LQH0_RETFI|nr:hypothetical protein RFI_34428 [Reticulomyxa filosa]|eukprot:ETO02985.1 hypothetical protein RFI_34428 [Reticulomyxa filosa]
MEQKENENNTKKINTNGMVTLSKSEDVMKILQDKDLQNVYTIAQAVLFDKNKSRPKSYFKQCQNCFKLNHVAKECPSILNVFLQKKASHSQSIQIKKKPDNKANHNEPNNRRRKRTKQTYNTRAVIQINDTNQEMKSTYQILTHEHPTAGAEHPNSKNQKHSKNGNKIQPMRMDASNNMDKFEKVVKGLPEMNRIEFRQYKRAAMQLKRKLKQNRRDVGVHNHQVILKKRKNITN